MNKVFQDVEGASKHISVVVPVKNMERTILECLESISKNDPYEIIVIDGNSTDSTVEIARRYTSNIYSDHGFGPSYAHKLGTEIARGKYVAFVDGDIILPDKALETMARELQEAKVAGIQAQWHGASSNNYWERAQDWHSQEIMRRKPGGLSAVVLDKEVVRTVGFDVGLRLYGDDFDFIKRFRLRGFSIGTSSVVVLHGHRMNMGAISRQHFMLGLSIMPMMQKWGVEDLGFWPPAVLLYWAARSIVQGKAYWIPYLMVIYFSQVAGMIAYGLNR